MSDLIAYMCLSCHYRFKRRGEWARRQCPYCGKEDVELQSDTLNKLIDEA